MKVTTIERKFKYNSISLPDPNSSLSPDAVREVYSAQYPELASAVVEGPVTSGQVSTWTFVRAVGSKGLLKSQEDKVDEGLPKAVQDALKGGSGRTLPELDDKSRQIAGHMMGAIRRKHALGTPLIPMPSAAFGLWG